jgi:hypothetical protein
MKTSLLNKQYKGGMPLPELNLETLSFFYKSHHFILEGDKEIREHIRLFEQVPQEEIISLKDIFLFTLEIKIKTDSEVAFDDLLAIYCLTKIGALANDEYNGMSLLYSVK